MLRVFDEMPQGLLDADARGLAALLGGPSLIHVSGDGRAPLLVSTLLHGNETTGWDAVRRLLGAREAVTARPLLLFIGNVHAAREGLRHLDEQPDFNRIWRGATGPEADMAARVLAEVERTRPAACVDVHNTSGENPVYACVHRLDDATLALAAHFSATSVLVTHPESLLSMALSARMPAITLECGKPGNAQVARRVSGLLATLAGGRRAGTRSLAAALRLQLLRRVARVRVPDDVSFSFHDETVDLRFWRGSGYVQLRRDAAGTHHRRIGAGLRGAGPVCWRRTNTASTSASASSAAAATPW